MKYFQHQVVLSSLTRVEAPYMLGGMSLLLMWVHCLLKKGIIEFQIFLPWWRKNWLLLEKEMRRRGFKKKGLKGDLSLSYGYMEVWDYHGVTVELFSYTYEGDFTLTGLWTGFDLYPCYMRVTEQAKYQFSHGVSAIAPHPLEESLESAYGPHFRKEIKEKTFLAGYDPFTWFCMGVKAKNSCY